MTIKSFIPAGSKITCTFANGTHCFIPTREFMAYINKAHENFSIEDVENILVDEAMESEVINILNDILTER